MQWFFNGGGQKTRTKQLLPTTSAGYWVIVKGIRSLTASEKANRSMR